MLLEILGYLSLFSFALLLYKGGTFLHDYRYKMSLYNYDLPPSKFPTEFPYAIINPGNFFHFEYFYKVEDKIISSDDEFIPVLIKQFPRFNDEHLPFVVIFDPDLTFGIIEEYRSTAKYYFYINEKKVFKKEPLKDCIVAYWAVKKTSRGQILYSDIFWISVDECTEKERQIVGENHIVFRHSYTGYFNTLYNILDRMSD